MPKSRNQKVYEKIYPLLINKYGLAEFESEAATREILAIVFPERNLSQQQVMFGALCRTMVVDPRLVAGRISKFAMSLLEAGYTPEKIMEWYGDPEDGRDGCFWKEDWRSRKNSKRPNEKDIADTIREYKLRSEHKGDSERVVIS